MRSLLSLWRIALRNVLRNRRRTLITLAALLVGVSVMVTIRGVLNGMQQTLVDNVVLGQTGALQVHRKGYLANVLASPLTMDMDQAAVVAKVKAVPGVKDATARIAFGGMVALGDETIFMFNQAVDPATEFRVCPRRREAIHDDGQFVGDAGGGGEGAKIAAGDAMVVTNELARALAAQKARPAGAEAGADGAKAGAKADDDGGDASPGSEPPAALLAPDRDGALSGENVSLVGTLDLNGPGERKFGLVRLDVAQRLLKMEGRVTEVAVAVDDVDAIERVQAALQAALGPEFEVHNWEEIATFVVDIRTRQNAILKLVAGVFMLLMLLGVANTMLMSVLDRTREIGTMMAIGVRRGRIVSLFLIEAAVIGLLGGALGGGIGYGLTALLAQNGIVIAMPGSSIASIIVPFVSLGYLASVASIAALGAVLFALYPAWRASRLRPVEALAGG
jgi:putative ABC transport system permease protein